MPDGWPSGTHCRRVTVRPESSEASTSEEPGTCATRCSATCERPADCCRCAQSAWTSSLHMHADIQTSRRCTPYRGALAARAAEVSAAST